MSMQGVNRGCWLALIALLFCGAAKGQTSWDGLLITEIMPVNHNVYFDPYYEADSWVELYNASDHSIMLTGLFLTTDLAATGHEIVAPNGEQVRVEPGSYVVFWLDKGTRQARNGLHCNLRLGQNGGFIALFSPKREVIDELDFPMVPVNHSFGRIDFQADRTAVFYSPTPGGVNKAELPQPKSPEFDHTSGAYDKAFRLAILQPDTSLTTTYSTAGQYPLRPGKRTYRKPIEIAGVKTIRAISQAADGRVSEVNTGSFLVNNAHALPVVSIVADGWWDWYSTGNRDQTSREIPAHITWVEADGQTLFATDVALKLSGGASRVLPQKSIAIRWRKSFGSTPFSGQLFPHRSYTGIQDFTLRNGGNGPPKTYLKDAVLQHALAGLPTIDYLDARPCVVYVNSDYYGIYVLREKKSKSYVQQNHGIAPKNIEMVEVVDGTPVSGTAAGMESFQALLNFVKQHDLSDAANYAEVTARIDLDNFIDYQIAEIYYANTDWPLQNIKAWKTAGDGGRWRWILFDLDQCFQLANVELNTLEYALGKDLLSDGANAGRHSAATVLLRKLMENADFEQRFVTRFVTFLNFEFSPVHLLREIEQHRIALLPEIARHLDHWNAPQRIGPGGRGMLPPDSTAWERAVDELREFARQRPATMRAILVQHFKLGEAVTVTIKNTGSAQQAGGWVTIDGHRVEPTAEPLIYHKGQLLAITAEPAKGFRFVRWKGMDSKEPVATVALSKSIELEPVFEPVPQGDR